MPEETQTSQNAAADEVKDIPLPDEFKGHKLKRGNIEVDLVDFKITRGNNRGQHFICPEVTEANLDTMLAWWERQQVAEELQDKLKKYFQSIWFQSKDDETGVIDFQYFMGEAAEFDAAGMPISQLRKKIDEHRDQIKEQAMAAVKNPALYTSEEWRKQMEDLGNKCSKLEAKEAKKSKRGKKEEEPEAAVLAAAGASVS